MTEVGRKHDNDKPRFDLLPPGALEEIAKVFSEGAKKYDDRNWECGIKYGRVFGAAQRHLWKWMGGQDNDPEWGLSHLAHAAAGILFLLHYQSRGKEFQDSWDDRPDRRVLREDLSDELKKLIQIADEAVARNA